MPSTYWLPVADVRRPVPVEHLHAALSGWFDGDDPGDTPHDAQTKPYRISPIAKRDDGWGVELSVLEDDAESRLAARVETAGQIRLGSLFTTVSAPVLLHQTSWHDLAMWNRSRAWTLRFVTPATFRTGSRASPFPTLGALLRAPTESWAAFGPAPSPLIPPPDQRRLWVSEFSIESTPIRISERTMRGVRGSLTIRAADDDVARRADALFRLTPFCGVGSFRVKGLGLVRLGCD